VLGTGGTIATRVAADGVGHVGRSIDGLLAGLPLPPGVTVEAVDLVAKGSNLLTGRDQAAIARAVLDAADRADGVVVAHGTDTLEETALLIDLVHAGPVPVVVTGAQRTADTPDADGPRNLADAIALAADPAARGLGAVVAFGGRILPARGVYKSDTTRTTAFAHRGGVCLGRIDGDRVRVGALPVRAAHLSPAALDRFGQDRVDVLWFTPSTEPDLIPAALAADAAGLVVAGAGVGNTTPEWVEAIRQAILGGAAVVLASRAPLGPVVPLPGFGGGADALAVGALSAGILPPAQARVALQAGLAGRFGHGGLGPWFAAVAG